MKARAHGCSLKLAAEKLCTFQAESLVSSFRRIPHLQQLGMSAKEPLFSAKTRAPYVCSSPRPLLWPQHKITQDTVPHEVCLLMLHEFPGYICQLTFL